VQRLARNLRNLAIALALVTAAASPALAYGVATHAWLADQEATRLAQRDPSLQFLATDADARMCFVYGAVFPDIRSIARKPAGFDTLRQKLLSQSFVSDVRFSTDGVATAFTGVDTHSCDYVLSLVARAEASGDRYKKAFALGNLAHVMQDKHAQLFHIQSYIQGCTCGDLGVEPVQNPALVAGWHPGTENEVFFEAIGDMARPQATLERVRDLPWILHGNMTVAHNRALDLRHFYWEAVDAYARQTGVPPPTEAAVANAAQLFEVSLSFYATLAGAEPFADSGRRFVERYVVLQLWAQIIAGAAQAVATNLSGGQDLFDLLGPLVLPQVAAQVGGQSPIGEIIFATGQGGAELAKVRAKYAANPEFVRLDASGLLERSTYLATSYDCAHEIVLDGLLRRTASRYTSDVIWPRYSTAAMRAAATRSLLRAGTPETTANAPGLLVWEVRFVDAATGAPLTEVVLPGDVGRRVRAEVELFGTDTTPVPRLVRLRLRADTGAGAGDPLVATESAIVSAAHLDLRTYGTQPRPVVFAEWTVADVPGARGVHIELDERRLSPVRDESAADALLITDTTRLAPWIAGRAHYDRNYDPYAGDLAGLKVRR
jgi:hypothetical protein